VLIILLPMVACLFVGPPQNQGSAQASKPAAIGQPEKITDQKSGDSSQATASSAKPKRAQVPIDLSGFDLLDSGKLKTQAMVTGQTRGGPRGPILMAPRLGKIFGSNPVFEWDYHGHEGLVFVLSDDQHREIFRAPVNGRRYSYPGDAPKLTPGKTYFWTVYAELTAPATSAGFIVLADEQRSQVEERLAAIAGSDPYQVELARARLFTEYRLWYDAIAIYTDLISRFPHEPIIYEERGTIYAQLPITKGLSRQDLARSDKLQMEDRQ
jgi:hypothetical protein